jgi:hypothetical protein
MSGKCPYCKELLKQVRIESIEMVGVPGAHKGISYVCSHCDTVLNVSMNPIALNENLLSEIQKK